jgi:hypothetical protein
MRPVSNGFLASLRGSHKALFRARVVTTFQTGTDPTGDYQEIISGAVRLDGTADERSALDITIAGDWPANHQFSDIAPFGQELFVERGVEGAGTTGAEYVSLGYFRIETVEQDDAPRSPLRITGRDRMAAIIEARMLEPVTFAAGTTFEEIFENLVLEVYPNAEMDIYPEVIASTIREASTVEEDRYGFLRDMATSRGCIMYFDYRGILVVTPAPDPAVPVWRVDAGPTGVLISARRQLSRAGVYNAVVASGTEADTSTNDPPPRAAVLDEDPDSATYFYGPFGKVPRFYSSPLLYTDAQCELAAASILERVTGLPYSMDLTAIPNPALEPLDPIGVVLGEELLNDTALFMDGTAGSYFGTPDHTSLDITGDIDIRALIQPTDWTPAANNTIVSKMVIPGQRSYDLTLLPTGEVAFFWTTDGSTVIQNTSTVATGFVNNTAHWVRVTRSGTDINFYTSDDGENWVQLGTTVVTSGSAMHSGTAGLLAGAWNDGTTALFAGYVHRIEVRNGVNGPLVAAPYFDEQAPGTTAFADLTGKTWTLTGSDAEITLTGTQSRQSRVEVHVIDTLTVPLSPDTAMTANVRSTVDYSITG